MPATMTGRPVGVVAYTRYATDARVMRTAESLQRAGFRVDVYTPRDAGEPAAETIRGVTLTRLPVAQYNGTGFLGYVASYLGFFLLCFGRLAWRQIGRRYRLIYVNNMPDFLVFVSVPSRLLGAKVVLDIHDPMPETYLAKFGQGKRGLVYRLLKLQERCSAAYADRVVTVHEPVKRDILVKDGLRADKISVVANFPDGDVFRPVEDYRLDRPLRMIYYGTISKRFALERVIGSVAGLKRKDGLFLKIIGRGDGAAGLEKAISTHAIGPRVDFENRTYPLRQIPLIIRDYHLGIVPYEPGRATDYMLPVKMLELTAAGIPVITVANTAIRHYFSPDLFFAYDPSRADSLTALLDDLIGQPGPLLTMREALLKKREDYLWEKEAGKLIGLVVDLTR